MDLATYKARRPRRDQASLLVLAFVCSVVAHVGFALAWEFRAHLPHLAWLDWLKTQSAKLNPAALLMKLDAPKPLPPELKKLLATQPPPEDPPMPQLTFVDVDPALAAEPPKDAKFYSTVSTRAANPDAQIQSNVPKLDGKQTQMVKVLDVPKPLPPAEPPPAPQPKAPTPPPEAKTSPEPKPQPTPTPQVVPASQTKPAAQSTPPQKAEPKPLQPTPPPTPKPAGETLPQPKAAPPAPRPPAPTQVAKASPDFPSAPALNPSTAKPTPPPEPGEAETKITRPRTVKEALARRAESGLVGEKMQQDGGVKNLGVSALDVRGMAFGAYDAAIIHAIQQRWYSLLESRPTPHGKVVVEFRMHYDGRVTDMKINDADVGELYSLFCQKAVQDPSPYPRWPSDMRRQLQADHRDVRFTFYYN